jgi:hypothetical protein
MSDLPVVSPLVPELILHHQNNTTATSENIIEMKNQTSKNSKVPQTTTIQIVCGAFTTDSPNHLTSTSITYDIKKLKSTIQ